MMAPLRKPLVMDVNQGMIPKRDIIIVVEPTALCFFAVPTNTHSYLYEPLNG